ncbi:MAG: DUF1592 domain-containing protein [Gemmatimonas sp.]
MLRFVLVAGLLSALPFASPPGAPRAVPPLAPPRPSPVLSVRGIPTTELTEVVQRYCASCHSPTQKRGNLSLKDFDVSAAASNVAVSEKMIRKLRAGMMPPPGSRRPTGDTLLALVEALEAVIDKAGPPSPGTRTFQRLNRPEYERVVRDLLAVQVQAGDFLPLDTKSANFDNISDAQSLSPTLLDAYLNAAAAVSRMAVGDRTALSSQTTYKTSPFASQHPWDHVEGTPYGTRGGIVAMHTFPADGEYQLRLNVAGGIGTRLEDLDVSVDGERVALLRYEKGIARNNASADMPNGQDYVRSEPIRVRGGQRRLSVAFVRRQEGPYEDLIKPHDWSRASAGTASAGTTEPPALTEVMVTGPTKVTGISDNESRRKVFSCRPEAKAAQRACANEIITRIATQAYRRPLTARDRSSLMSFYDKASSEDAANGFETGVRTALQAVLASPYFVFRFESAPAGIAPGKDYAISDIDLASRLSFFMWGTIPDARLLALASHQQLSNRTTFNAEVKRMLADPRAEALSTRFAAQWLRLQDLEKVHPDAFLFPDFDLQLANAMQRETELLFNDIVRNDRNILDLFTANYTFVNERLARHYGIPNISGSGFQRALYADETRRGLLGHGSVLVQTSLGNRTSPVLRGKWVMEVLIGMPPPPPPPNIPDLEETQSVHEGKQLTTRQRMEIHRANPTCKSCHQYMDPIGLALDNFDVTGKLRFRENGAALDTRGTMYDGMTVSTPAELTKSLLSRPIPLVRSFTENLMAYALGRRVEDADQPTVRAIERATAAKGYRLSAFVYEVVNSSAFRSKRADAVADDASSNGQHGPR